MAADGWRSTLARGRCSCTQRSRSSQSGCPARSARARRKPHCERQSRTLYVMAPRPGMQCMATAVDRTRQRRIPADRSDTAATSTGAAAAAAPRLCPEASALSAAPTGRGSACADAASAASECSDERAAKAGASGRSSALPTSALGLNGGSAGQAAVAQCEGGECSACCGSSPTAVGAGARRSDSHSHRRPLAECFGSLRVSPPPEARTCAGRVAPYSSVRCRCKLRDHERDAYATQLAALRAWPCTHADADRWGLLACCLQVRSLPPVRPPAAPVGRARTRRSAARHVAAQCNPTRRDRRRLLRGLPGWEPPGTGPPAGVVALLRIARLCLHVVAPCSHAHALGFLSLPVRFEPSEQLETAFGAAGTAAL